MIDGKSVKAFCGCGLGMVAASVVVILATTVSAQTPSSDPTSQDSRPAVQFPLAAQEVLPLGLCLDSLSDKLSFFQHEPFETAGYCHLTLPFRYRSTVSANGNEPALAFSFLMHRALEWGHGCYSARSPYFVFKRDRKIMEQLVNRYDPRIIATAVKEWDATHAVGGTILQMPSGFGGILEIYDANGRRVLIRNYQSPRDYFDLLAEMAGRPCAFPGPHGTPANPQMHRLSIDRRPGLGRVRQGTQQS